MTDYNGRFIFHDNDDFALYATFEQSTSLLFPDDAEDFAAPSGPVGVDPFSSEEIVPLTLPSELLSPLIHNWTTSATLESAFITDVAKATNLAEDRRGLVSRPQRTLSVFNTGLTRAQSWKLISNLRRHGNGRTVVPLITDHSRVTAVTTLVTIHCVTSFRRFFVGGRVMIVKVGQSGALTDEEYGEIESLTASDITLKVGDSLIGTFPAGSRVYPCIDVEVGLLNVHNILDDVHSEVTFRAEEIFGPSALVRTNETYPASFQLDADGDLVFSMRPDFGSVVEAKVIREGSTQLQGRSQLVSLHGARPFAGYSLSFTKLTREAIWPLIEFFDSRKGRLRSFKYVPVENYWTVDSLATTYVDIDEIGNFADLGFFDYVAIVKTDGTVQIREVDSRTDNGSTYRLEWTDVITVPDSADLARVVPAYKMRLMSDAMTEHWNSDGICSIEFEFVELINEGDVALECLF